MRLKAISLIVAMGISLSATAKMEYSKFLEGECRGPGGEGPKPLVQLPFSLSHIQPYSSANEVLDGLFLPLTGQFAFRDVKGNLKVTKLDSHATTALASVKKPLVRVRSESERFLSFDNIASVFDNFERRFYNYRAAYNGKIRPLFWDRFTQYSAVVSDDTDRNAKFRLQSYRVGDGNRARRVCHRLNFALNSGYQLGEGHVYPFMVLHRTEKIGKENKLTVSFLNVEDCTIQTKVYADLMKGEVFNVYYFAKLNSLLIETNHPTQQLIWDTGPDDKHCHYYSLKGSKLLMVSYEHNIIGAFDPYDGLSLIYLHDLDNNPPKAAQVTGDYPMADMNLFDVELSSDKNTLVGVTQLIDKSKTIIKIDVPKYDYP